MADPADPDVVVDSHIHKITTREEVEAIYGTAIQGPKKFREIYAVLKNRQFFPVFEEPFRFHHWDPRFCIIDGLMYFYHRKEGETGDDWPMDGLNLTNINHRRHVPNDTMLNLFIREICGSHSHKCYRSVYYLVDDIDYLLVHYSIAMEFRPALPVSNAGLSSILYRRGLDIADQHQVNTDQQVNVHHPVEVQQQQQVNIDQQVDIQQHVLQVQDHVNINHQVNMQHYVDVDVVGTLVEYWEQEYQFEHNFNLSYAFDAQEQEQPFEDAVGPQVHFQQHVNIDQQVDVQQHVLQMQEHVNIDQQVDIQHHVDVDAVGALVGEEQQLDIIAQYWVTDNAESLLPEHHQVEQYLDFNYAVGAQEQQLFGVGHAFDFANEFGGGVQEDQPIDTNQFLNLDNGGVQVEHVQQQAYIDQRVEHADGVQVAQAQPQGDDSSECGASET